MDEQTFELVQPFQQQKIKQLELDEQTLAIFSQYFILFSSVSY